MRPSRTRPPTCPQARPHSRSLRQDHHRARRTPPSQPDQPPRTRPVWPWAAAGVVVLLAVVIGVVIVTKGGHGKSEGPVSQVTGRVTDSQAGISYDQLGAPWTLATVANGWLAPNQFSAGQISVVQAPFEQYASFNATDLSGVPRTNEAATGTTGGVRAVAEAVSQRIQTERFAERYNRSAYTSKAMKVSGLSAWRVQYHLAFIDAKVRHWKFNADTISVVVVDRGQGKYGFLWTSVPDTFADQGDLDHVVASLKVP